MPRRTTPKTKPQRKRPDHPDRRVGLMAINAPGGHHDRRKPPRSIDKRRAINDSKEA